MKLRLKALAAASLLAVTGAASAAIESFSATTTSEMFLVAYDPINSITYTKDLGTRIDEFNFGASSSTVLTGFNTFLGTAGLNVDNVRWSIVAFDGFAPISMFSTGGANVANATGTGAGLTQTRISANNGNMASLVNVANTLGTHATEADGWAVQTTTGNGQGLPLFGNSGNFNVGSFIGIAALGTDQRFFSFTNGTPGGSTRTAQGNAFGPGLFSLNAANGTLGYVAPVPEPGTYALMLAGLLTLGAVVRRRTK